MYNINQRSDNVKYSLLIVFLLSILNSVLFFDNSLGLNVVLFIIPTLIFLIWALKRNEKIKNKKGLLFVIPIILLSCTYFIYDNYLFKILNGIFIPLLMIFMYVYTISPSYSLGKLFFKTMNLIFEPLTCIGKVYRLAGRNVSKSLKLNDKRRKILKGVLISLPIVIVVLILLGSADAVFSSIFKDIYKFLDKLFSDGFVTRIVLIIILFTYMAAVLNYLLFNFGTKIVVEKKRKGIENYTINILLTVLGVIYIVFDYIQIKSLMFHQVAEHINYAQYARTGFFQLLVISLINLIILVVSKQVRNKDDKYTKIISLVMVLLTLIIIGSSFMRMCMYESYYGYTLLRFLVYVVLFTEVILLIPTTIYILRDKMNIFRHYLVITVSIYTLLCLFPVDCFIAHNNINRYYENKKFDLRYLENYRTDNVPKLIELYNKTTDKDMKENVKSYLTNTLEFEESNIFEYNLSNEIAYKKIKDLK